MQNLKRYSAPEDIRKVLMETFRTDMFKDEIERGDETLLGTLVNETCKRPLAIYDFNRYDLEGSHFTSWMGAVQRRPYYTNDYIHDLHWTHELAHFATMPYDPSLSFAQWHEKMSLNEYEAALDSEAFIYMAMPDLRRKTFEFEIWVDRFLDPERMTSEWRRNLDIIGDHSLGDILGGVTDIQDGVCCYGGDQYDIVRTSLYQARQRAMMTPRPWDFVEMQIGIYAKQNIEWTLTWQNSWRKVEEFMHEMHQRHHKGEDTDDFYFNWISENSEGSYSEIGFTLPFRQEAKVFAAVLQDIRQRGGNQILGK